jgi:predicted TIM-barrel fold metal-dependent hydrolase
MTGFIDFRLRPPLPGYLEAVMYTNPERRDRFTRQLGLEPAPSASQRSMEACLAEMDAAGVAVGVLPARHSDLHGSTPNSAVEAIMRLYPGRFVGLAAFDPTQRRVAIAEIDRCIAAGMRGVNIEPGSYPVPMYPDDRRLYPIYAHCEDRSLPVVLMAGGNGGPDLSYSDPVYVDRVAADFPKLPIVISHGGWPWVHQILHVAYRRQNVYISPDMYLCNMPGMQDYIDAANGFLQDRFIYGSAYPLAPIQQYAQWFRGLPLKPEVMHKVTFQNAARLLGLEASTR